MSAQQSKSKKMQDLVIAENQNWNEMDQQKEKDISNRDTVIDDLRS